MGSQGREGGNVSYSLESAKKGNTCKKENGCTSAYRKDVRLPVQLQRAMAAEAEAAREARAKVTVLELARGLHEKCPSCEALSVQIGQVSFGDTEVKP